MNASHAYPDRKRRRDNPEIGSALIRGPEKKR
jgi:hypothetical protein